MRQVIRFEPNQPITVALEYPEGINVLGRGGPQVKFSLTENRLMYLDPEPARALGLLKLQPGELFVMTKRTERGKSPWWDFARVKAASRAIRAALPPDSPTYQPKTEPNPVSAPTPAIVPGDVKRIPPQSVPAQPPHAGGIHLTRTPPVKPSYEEAFRECLRIVTAGLAQTGEQWSDGAKQAMVSTLMIQLGRENRLGAFQPQQIGKVA